MNLTELLKQWLVEHCGIVKDASDDEFRKAAGEAIASGQLSAAKFAELTAPPEAEEANEFSKKLDMIADGLQALVAQKQEEKATVAEEEKQDVASTPVVQKAQAAKLPEQFDKAVGEMGGTPDEIDPSAEVRVKGAWERYDTTKSTLTYPEVSKSGRAHSFAGQPVTDFSERGRVLQTPSELDKAVSGVYSKFLIATAQRGGSKMFGYQALPEHDKELFNYAIENMEWVGSTDGGDYADINGKLTPTQRKDLIDDATSGGLEAAPIVFDDQVIQTPLLHGELFPLVNIVPIDRGRRIEGVATGTVTGAWGGVDATAIALFDTTGYVTAFDTTIYRWEGAIRIGLDFLSDTPIDFGAHVTTQYGERLLEDLDDVIATGNGTTQPEGVMTKAGTTTVNFAATTSLGNYESLRFGVAKPEHRPNIRSTAVFCGTETSYQRARAIPVGAADARRIFGMDYSSYAIMEHAYKINESLTNAQIFYAILARYRMYRRRGLTLRTSTEGDTLIRNNELLIVAHARFGGQLERGAVAAVTTTAPT